MKRGFRADFFQPVTVAMNGLVYTIKNQRHMRIHVVVVLLVILLGIVFKIRLRDMLILLFTIEFVLVAEMFNSAIEATVDLVEPKYHPLAKFAKDIAAGAVLITSTIAIVVGGLLLLGDVQFEQLQVQLGRPTGTTVPLIQRLILGLLAVTFVVFFAKGLGSRGQVFKGGLVSGHAAIGFFLAVTLVYVSQDPLVGGIAILLAAIIAQSRWEAKIHTVYELALGAIVGTLMALILFGWQGFR
ncbi:MAG: diacylglycerol kinase [Fimbriimonadaceae bacterium]